MRLIPLLVTFFFLIPNLTFSAETETIKIGAIFAKTGKSALRNTSYFNGIRIGVDEINEKGGVLGKQIQLIEFDNKSTPLNSRAAAKEAVKANVVTVIGANWSSNSLAIAPVLQKARIPMITPLSTNPAVTLVGNYIFRICYIDSFQGKAMANFVSHDLKAETAGVLINANRKYSEGLAQYFVQQYKSLGGKILFQENYLEQTVNFESIINKIKKFQPKIVFLPGHTKDSAFIIKQAKENGLSTIFTGGDGWSDFMYEIAENTIEGSYFTDHWHEGKTGEKSRQFVKTYENRSKKADATEALTYDSIYLLADALRRAKSSDPSKIRDAIATTKNFQGVTGNISFNKNGDPVKSAVILKFEKGTSIYVKTIDP